MVVVSYYVSPFELIIFNLAMWFISSVTLLMSLVGGDAFVVIGVICASSITSNMYPTTFVLVEETLHVIAPVMALLVTSISIGYVIMGPVAGALLHNVGVVTFPSTTFALFLTSTVLFIVYSVLTRVKLTVVLETNSEVTPVLSIAITNAVKFKK